MIKKKINLSDQKKYWEQHKNKRTFDHSIVNLFSQQRIDYLKQYLDVTKIKSAFDYGCGDGFSCYYMNKFIPHIEGGDVSEFMLRNNPLSKKFLHVLDGEHLPFSDNSFDMVYCWEVLHHVENPDIVMREMARVASNYVVVFEPNRNNIAQFLFGLFKKEERGTLRFNLKYLKRLAMSNDLRILHFSNVGWIFPNVTPTWIVPILKVLPYEFPFLPISCCLIAEKVKVGR